MAQPGAGQAVTAACIAAALAGFAVAAGQQQCTPLTKAAGEDLIITFDSLHSTPGAIDPVRFFEQLVERYRTISAYEDRTHVVEVTTPNGGEAQLRETDLECQITSEGELHVRTPGASLLGDFGVQIPFIGSAQMDETRQAYELWQAPHLALRFLADPLREFRVGSPEGFTATRARPVTIGKRELVQIELEATAESDEKSETQFDLYVDPESMLVERIEGRERLPDGATYETTMEIQPQQVRDMNGTLISRETEEVEAAVQTLEEPQSPWAEPQPAQSPGESNEEPEADDPAPSDPQPSLPRSEPEEEQQREQPEPAPPASARVGPPT